MPFRSNPSMGERLGRDVVLNERSVPLLIDGIPGDATRCLALAGQAEKGESAVGGVGERIPDALPAAIIGRVWAFWIVDTAQGVFPPVRNALILSRLRHPEDERFRHRGADLQCASLSISRAVKWRITSRWVSRLTSAIISITFL